MNSTDLHLAEVMYQQGKVIIGLGYDKNICIHIFDISTLLHLINIEREKYITKRGMRYKHYNSSIYIRLLCSVHLSSNDIRASAAQHHCVPSHQC